MSNFVRMMRFLGSQALTTQALVGGPIGAGVIQSAGIRMAGLCLSFAQAVLAARILGAEGYGVASFALSVVHVVAVFSVLGLGSLAVRELSRLRTEGRYQTIGQFVSFSTHCVALLAILASGALSAAAWAGIGQEYFHSAMLVSGLAVLPVAIIQLYRGISQGLGQIVAAQVPGELIRPGLLAAFLLLAMFIQFDLDPSGYITAFALSGVAAAAISLTFTWRKIPRTNSGALLLQKRHWKNQTMPFLGMALVAILLGEIATLMLGMLASPREAGLFQPIARIVPLMVLPAQIVSVAFAPRVAELWEQQEYARVGQISRVFTVLTSAATLVLVGLLIIAAPLIISLFGAEFLPSAPLIWIVGVAQIFNAAVGPVGHLLTMTGHASVALRGQIAALAINFLIGATLIPSQGAQGATIAMAVGLTVWNLVLLRKAKRLLGFDPSLFNRNSWTFVWPGRAPRE